MRKSIIPEAYSKPCQTSKMERFAKKCSTLDVWKDFECASEKYPLISGGLNQSGHLVLVPVEEGEKLETFTVCSGMVLKNIRYNTVSARMKLDPLE